MKRVIILSRMEAYKFSAVPSIPVCVIVSIHSLDGMPNAFASNDRIRAVAYFAFDDVESGDAAVSPAQAARIADFVRRWIDEVEAVAIHCDAGFSRSAGIGAAIMKWANGDDSAVFKKGWYRPNMRCYRLMLNALTEGEQWERGCGP